MLHNCPKCGIHLTPRERDAGACDLCGASLSSITSKSHSAPVPMSDSSSSRIVHRTQFTPAQMLLWSTARTGMLLMMAGLIMLLSSIVMIYLLIAAGSNGGPFDQGFSQVLLIGMMWAAGMLLTAPFLATAAPEESGARGWAIGSAACIILSLLGVVAVSMASNRSFDHNESMSARDSAKTIGYVVQVTTVLAGVFWSLFLYRTASVVGRPALATGVLVMLAASILNYVVIQFVTSGTDPIVQLQGKPEDWLLIDAIIFTVWHITVVGCVRSALTQSLTK